MHEGLQSPHYPPGDTIQYPSQEGKEKQIHATESHTTWTGFFCCVVLMFTPWNNNQINPSIDGSYPLQVSEWAGPLANYCTSHDVDTDLLYSERTRAPEEQVGGGPLAYSRNWLLAYPILRPVLPLPALVFATPAPDCLSPQSPWLVSGRDICPQLTEWVKKINGMCSCYQALCLFILTN